MATEAVNNNLLPTTEVLKLLTPEEFPPLLLILTLASAIVPIEDEEVASSSVIVVPAVIPAGSVTFRVVFEEMVAAPVNEINVVEVSVTVNPKLLPELTTNDPVPLTSPFNVPPLKVTF